MLLTMLLRLYYDVNQHISDIYVPRATHAPSPAFHERNLCKLG